MKRRICIIGALALGMLAKADVVTTVSSVADFQTFATSVNSGEDYNGVTVTLTTNLDLSEVTWTPIGTTAHSFTGTFDGKGHSISNLSADGSSDLAAGLFGVVGSGGTVKDVHITSGRSFISSNPSNYTCNIGSIAGINNGTIVGCSNAGNVMGYSYEHARTGGIVGENASGGKIQNCYNLGEVSSTKTEVYIGGIVGNNKGSVQNCFMKASVVKNSVPTAYPIYGNNGGTVEGCFYAGGNSADATEVVDLLDAGDNSSLLSSNNGENKNLLLDGRSLQTSGNWNTLCLPFAIAASGNGRSPIAGATVLELSAEASGYDPTTGILKLYFVEATEIVAGRPYLVKWTDSSIGGLSNPVFMDVAVSNPLADVSATNVVFKGCFSPVTLDANSFNKLYLGSSNTLYYPSKNVTIRSFRAYFDVDATSEVKSFVLNFGDEDDETGISEMSNVKWEMGNVKCQMGNGIYDVIGRRVSQPTKGLYIKNGRKYIVK